MIQVAYSRGDAMMSASPPMGGAVEALMPPNASTTPAAAIPSAVHARRPSSGRPILSARTATTGG